MHTLWHFEVEYLSSKKINKKGVSLCITCILRKPLYNVSQNATY